MNLFVSVLGLLALVFFIGIAVLWFCEAGEARESYATSAAMCGSFCSLWVGIGLFAFAKNFDINDLYTVPLLISLTSGIIVIICFIVWKKGK